MNINIFCVKNSRSVQYAVLSMLLFLGALTATAQELKVKSFAIMPTDLTARKQPRQDLNGRQCTLLKVMVMDDITDCGNANIGSIGAGGVVKLVYVPSVIKSITLSFKYHYPLTVVFADYGVQKLDGGATYELRLVDEIKMMAESGKEQRFESKPAKKKLTSANISNAVIAGIVNNMVLVEGGTFHMGDDNEDGKQSLSAAPVHSVTLDDFYIGKYEVTQEQWKAVMGKNPSVYPPEKKQLALYPVCSVSWDDCQKFVTKLNKITGMHFRLPTEAEWEYAARGGNKSKGYKFAGSDYAHDVAWYNDNSKVRYGYGFELHQIGQMEPNELGLYDMSGNVSEWCQDFSSDYTAEPQVNPQGPEVPPAKHNGEHIIRGGAYDALEQACRVSRRFDLPSTYKFSTNGLRLALDL